MAHMTWDLRTQHNPYHGGRETRGYPPYGRVYVCVCVCMCVCVGWVGGQRVHPCQRVPRLHMFPVDRPVTTWYRAGGDNLFTNEDDQCQDTTLRTMHPSRDW